MITNRELDLIVVDVEDLLLPRWTATPPDGTPPAGAGDDDHDGRRADR